MKLTDRISLCKFYFCFIKCLIFISNHGGSLPSRTILFGVKFLMTCRNGSLNNNAWLLTHLSESFLFRSKALMAFFIRSLLVLYHIPIQHFHKVVDNEFLSRKSFQGDTFCQNAYLEVHLFLLKFKCKVDKQ